MTLSQYFILQRSHLDEHSLDDSKRPNWAKCDLPLIHPETSCLFSESFPLFHLTNPIAINWRKWSVACGWTVAPTSPTMESHSTDSRVSNCRNGVYYFRNNYCRLFLGSCLHFLKQMGLLNVWVLDWKIFQFLAEHYAVVFNVVWKMHVLFYIFWLIVWLIGST